MTVWLPLSAGTPQSDKRTFGTAPTPDMPATTVMPPRDRIGLTKVAQSPADLV
jgi:hypothetical protein